MSQRKAVMIIDQVLRKYRLLRDHPNARIVHQTAPSWHWRGWWLDEDGVIQQRVNADLGLLIDDMTEALDQYGRRP